MSVKSSTRARSSKEKVCDGARELNHGMDGTGPWADSAEVKVSTFALQVFFSVLMVFKNLEKNSLEILPDHY